MATKDTKVTAGDVVSATIKFTNKDDVDRKFDISAEVNIQDKNIVSYNNGYVTIKDSQDNGNANFNAGTDFNYFSFNSNGFNALDVKEAVGAVITFIEDVKTNIEKQNVNE